jgi:hypothetical protein
MNDPDQGYIRNLGPVGYPGAEARLGAQIQRFREDVRGYKRSTAIFSCLTAGCGTIAVVILAGLTICTVPSTSNSVSDMISALIVSPVGVLALIGGSILWVMRASRREEMIGLRSQISALTTSNDLRAIGPLLTATTLRDAQIDQMARSSLTRMMASAALGNPDSLDASEMETLHYSLYSRDTEYVLAALNLLKFVGSRNSLWFVEGLTGETPVSSVFAASGAERIRAAAKETAAFIKDRLGRKNERNVLLRPTGERGGEVELLRPVEGAGPAAAEQLLRADESENEQTL